MPDRPEPQPLGGRETQLGLREPKFGTAATLTTRSLGNVSSLAGIVKLYRRICEGLAAE